MIIVDRACVVSAKGLGHSSRLIYCWDVSEGENYVQLAEQSNRPMFHGVIHKITLAQFFLRHGVHRLEKSFLLFCQDAAKINPVIVISAAADPSSI